MLDPWALLSFAAKAYVSRLAVIDSGCAHVANPDSALTQPPTASSASTPVSVLYTYSVLQRRSCRVASWLMRVAGMEAGSCIGLLMRNRREVGRIWPGSSLVPTYFLEISITNTHCAQSFMLILANAMCPAHRSERDPALAFGGKFRTVPRCMHPTHDLQVLEVHFACAAAHLIVVNINVALAPAELQHVLQVWTKSSLGSACLETCTYAHETAPRL